jgi:hypothetical protein
VRADRLSLGRFCAAVAASVFIAFLVGGYARANTIANWEKSARSWNNSHMSRIKASMEQAGHYVLPDAPISDQTRNSAVLVLGEPLSAPTASEASLLRRYVEAGGVVLLFGDTGIDLTTYNSLLSGLGSAIQFTTSTVSTTSALPVGEFTTAPSKISGSSLNVTSGTGTAGGSAIDSNFVRFERIGNGFIFVFGDRIDHNDVMSATNEALLLNIVAVAAEAPVRVPMLGTVPLTLLVLALAAIAGGRSRQRPLRAKTSPARR